jgi:hypothetical protein
MYIFDRYVWIFIAMIPVWGTGVWLIRAALSAWRATRARRAARGSGFAKIQYALYEFDADPSRAGQATRRGARRLRR